ncbi:MAG: PrsW family intramembrane metalloprotease [Clostridia bacterium]|nr:PrsW family intramembrane metalloprotease [Clostridia bacterium]
MIVLILAFLAGCVPSLILFFWFRNLKKQNVLYKKNCSRMLASGMLTVFPVMLFSTCIVILLDVSGVKTSHPVLAAALHAFLTAALSEELCKFWMFRRRLKKIEGEHSWLDLTVYSTIVGIGFGLFESVVYVFESNPIVMLIRGISIPHGGYAAIVGYFYAKSIKENKKGYAILGILISFLIHGLYDFSLSKEIETVTDASGFIAVNLALLELVIIIVLIRFLRRNKDNAKYTEPLVYDKII